MGPNSLMVVYVDPLGMRAYIDKGHATKTALSPQK